AQSTSSGSKSGRERASFLGINEVGSSSGTCAIGGGGVVRVDIRYLQVGRIRKPCRYASGNVRQSDPMRAPERKSAPRQSKRCPREVPRTGAHGWGKYRL